MPNYTILKSAKAFFSAPAQEAGSNYEKLLNVPTGLQRRKLELRDSKWAIQDAACRDRSDGDSLTRFDYTGEAGVYAGKSKVETRGPRYRRFETAAEALRFAVEDMPNSQQRGSLLEIGEARYSQRQIRVLYDAPGYPLSRRLG
ncbi:hypothetical protein [Agrobacterium cavarae]